MMQVAGIVAMVAPEDKPTLIGVIVLCAVVVAAYFVFQRVRR